MTAPAMTMVKPEEQPSPVLTMEKPAPKKPADPGYSLANAPTLNTQAAPTLSLAPANSGTAQAPAPSMTAPAMTPPALTLAPASTIAAPAQPVNRLELAKSGFETMERAAAPGNQQRLNAVTQQAAGLGQLGSGQWRTGLRDEANRQSLELATRRDDLLNKALEGSIADASTAFQQGLASSQQNLAAELGRAGVDVSKQNADTSRLGTTGGLELEKERLNQSGDQFDKSLALQQKAQEIEAAYKNGSLSLAERDQKLRELEAQRADTRATQQFDFQKAQTEIENKFKAGQMSLAERDQALRELQQQQQNELAKGGLQLERDRLAQSGEQFKASLAENARQFGLSQEQQMALAKLADATSNRQIDVQTAQGKNQLLLQLASILGGPTGTLNPSALAAIAKAFGIDIAGTAPSGQTNTGTGTTAGTPPGGKPTGTTGTQRPV